MSVSSVLSRRKSLRKLKKLMVGNKLCPTQTSSSKHQLLQQQAIMRSTKNAVKSTKIVSSTGKKSRTAESDTRRTPHRSTTSLTIPKPTCTQKMPADSHHHHLQAQSPDNTSETKTLRAKTSRNSSNYSHFQMTSSINSSSGPTSRNSSKEHSSKLRSE